MPHPLQTRVESVRRQAIGLVRARSLSLLIAAVIALLMGFGLLDFFLHLHDPGARWILSGCLLAAMLWTAIRLLRPALRYRLSLVQVAQRIERVYPQLENRLSSAMDFLAQGEADPTAGSADLRRAVVAETEALSTELDFQKAIDPTQFSRAGIITIVVTLIGSAVLLPNQHASGLAITRLAMPWKDLAWPRRNQLEFVRRPDKIAVGDDFEVELVDRHGRLPDVVQIQLRHVTPTGTRTETKEMKPLADRMVFRLDNVTQPFAYRARGGDDDAMPWTEVAVIEPPKVVALDLAVQPPAYTGLPPESTGRVVRAIVGSTLSLSGKVDKPIVSAVLKSQSAGTPMPAVQIAADGLRFSAPAAGSPAWMVEKSAAYWVELTDASGLPTGRDTRLEVQAVPDLPPVLAWEAPADHTFVTPRAVIGIKCLVKDDLAIKNVKLRYLRPGMSDQGELLIDLYAGPPQAKPPAMMGDGESRSIDYSWDLAQLAGLLPGDVLAVRLTAEDYKPQLSTTIVRRLTIITEQELESRLGQRQTSILSQLAEALRLARDCRQQLAALQIRLEERGKLDESDLNHLQSAQLNQRQVEKLLGAGSEGVEGQILALLDELAANRIEGQAISQRMNDLLAKVRTLNREPLVEISQRLTDAFKAVREAMDGCAEPGDVGDSLAKAATRQDEVIQSLESLLGTLSEWDSFSRLAREIGQIRGDQEKLAGESELLRLKSAVAAADLPAEDRAAARQLAQRQLELARRLDKIQARMEEMLGRLTGTDPVAAGTLADALDAARRLAIGGQMRDAASKLTGHQFGQSRQSQQVALDGLKQLLDLLSSRREDELARTAKSLREAAGELDSLLARQQATQAQLDAAAAEPNPAEKKRRLERLTKELEELAKQIEQLGRKLQRLQAPQAASATQQAGQQAAAAGQSAGQGDAGQAQEQSRTTRQRLEEAQRELVRAIAQVEEELARQQMARLEQWLTGLLARQKNVVAETVRLEMSRSGNEQELSRAAQQTIRNLSAEQRLIGDETAQLRLKIQLAAFAFALEGAEQEMQRAAALLGRGQTDDTVQASEQSAATRLEQILAAFKPDEGGATGDSPPDQQPPPNQGQEPGEMASSLAELKLLQLLQGEIQSRTTALEALRGKQGQLTDEQARELDSLAQQQGRLADMVLNLIRASAARPEDNPESLPEPNGPAKPMSKKPTLDQELLKELEK